MDVHGQDVAPLERCIDLHQIGQRQRHHRHADQRVEQEEQPRRARVRGEVTRTDDGHAGPPAYIAVTKSVGVSPLLARMAVPSSGCMINAAPSVRPRAQTPTSSTRMTGPQKDRTAPRLEPKTFEALTKEAQTSCPTLDPMRLVPIRA